MTVFRGVHRRIGPGLIGSCSGLAHAIFAEGLRNVVAGASAVDLKRGIDRGLAVAVEALKGISRPVSSAREAFTKALDSEGKAACLRWAICAGRGPSGSGRWRTGLVR